MRLLLISLLLAFSSSVAVAEVASKAAPVASETAVESRLVALAAELRCLVCQNESLASSRAPLAEDLRREIREQISSGKSDPQIIDYLIARYGDFVTYRPPLRARTILLWLGPALLLILAVGMFIRALIIKRSEPIPVDAEALLQLQREFAEKKNE